MKVWDYYVPPKKYEPTVSTPTSFYCIKRGILTIGPPSELGIRHLYEYEY